MSDYKIRLMHTFAVLTVLMVLGMVCIFWFSELDEKLDQILDNWNDCQMTCDQGDFPRLEHMYAYDERAEEWTRVSREDVELPAEVARAMCGWARWMGAVPGDVGLGPMLAKACKGGE